MQVDTIKQSDLTQSERDVLKEDATRWHRMGTGAHLDDWLAYYPGLSIRRRLAMRMAFVNKPEGKGYALAFGELMRADDLHTMDKTSISAVLWLGDDPERLRILREMREAMTPGQRSRLNSPISARQRVEKITTARKAGTEETMKASPVALLKAKLTESQRAIAHLEEKLASAEQKADGSRFDLVRDSANDIATAIVDSAEIGRGKKAEIGKLITEKLKAKQSPAG